jgi:hypothetical protein
MMPDGAAGSRFLDRGRWLAAYSDLIYVACPRCGGQAVVIPRPGLPERRYYNQLLYRPRRLTCPLCGAAKEWFPQKSGAGLVAVTLGGRSEPFFGRPLWLQAPCCGHVLWAYNGRHLDALESFVSAELRERTGYASRMAMIPRLPAWIKRANHRAEIARTIGRLRDQLQRAAPGDWPQAAFELAGEPGARPYRGMYFGRP